MVLYITVNHFTRRKRKKHAPWSVCNLFKWCFFKLFFWSVDPDSVDVLSWNVYIRC